MATKVVTYDDGGTTKVVTYEEQNTIPASDNFGGVDPNSGSVGDTRFDQRWTETYQAGSGTTSITSNKYRVTYTDKNNNDLDLINGGGPDAGSGDFDISADFTVVTKSTPATSGGTIYELQVVKSGTEYRIQWAENSTARNLSVIKTGSGVLFGQEVTQDNYVFRIVRSGSDMLFYAGGALKYTDSGGITGSISDFRMRFKQAGSRTVDAVIDMDYFTAVDGSSNNITINIGSTTKVVTYEDTA